MRTVCKILAMSAVLGLTACAANDPYQRTKTGAAIGAVAGAVLGHQLDDDSGAYIGAAVGALAGGAIGNYMDRQEAAFNQALYQEQQRSGLEIQRLSSTLKVAIPGEALFDFDSDRIKPAFYSSLDKMAQLLQEYNQSFVTIVGYTDNRGSEQYNLDLSRRRAESVAQYLTSRGVASNRLRVEGRGENVPRASNATESGRAWNRRVELLIQSPNDPAVSQQAPYPQQQGYANQPPYPQQQQQGYANQPPYPQQAQGPASGSYYPYQQPPPPQSNTYYRQTY